MREKTEGSRKHTHTHTQEKFLELKDMSHKMGRIRAPTTKKGIKMASDFNRQQHCKLQNDTMS